MAGAASEVKHPEPGQTEQLPQSSTPLPPEAVWEKKIQVETVEVGIELSWCSRNTGKMCEGLSHTLQVLSGVIPHARHYLHIMLHKVQSRADIITSPIFQMGKLRA